MRGYSVYYDISLCHRRLYMYITVCGYTCIFTLKAVLHHSHFTVWLYHFMCGYTFKHIVIHIYLFHYTACGYTRGYASRYTVISVYTHMSSIHTYSNIVLYVSFSKYVSTLFFIHTYIWTYSVDYQTT